jgi:hypothetical protein
MQERNNNLRARIDALGDTDQATRSALISRLPLEEAMAYVNAPVYGLTEDVCGMQKGSHVYTSEHSMKLEYYSPRYGKHPKIYKELNFLVSSHIVGPEIPLERRAKMSSSHRLSTWILVGDLTEEERRHQVFVAKDAVFTIDGKRFNGNVTYYTAPVCYSGFVLFHEDIGVQGEALGPSLEELIQILESLHVLNGKEVE